MRMSWLVCVLLGAVAWGQAAPAAPPTPRPGQAAAPAAPPDMSASVPPTAAVITVKGVCAAQPKAPVAKGAAAKPTSAKSPAAAAPADCKTVITKAEFEKLAGGLSPNLTPQLKRQLASILPRLIAMSDDARKKGLDKTAQFEETVKFAKMQILTNELQRKIQEEAAQVPKADIDAYYKEHPQDFEQFNLDRLFVPRTKQEHDVKDEDEKDKDQKLTDEQKKAKEAEEKAKADQGEEDMTKLADALRARAAAGDDFMKLQKEAFEAAGMKIESPTVNLPTIRRTGLPPAHAAVFDLKAGEVSQVINDAGGHYIYKVNTKEVLPLDSKVEQEIHNKLQNERTRTMMDAVNNSFKVETNEAYFGPPGAGPGAAPPHMPRPHLAPAPTSPAPQTPPPTKAPDAKQN